MAATGSTDTRSSRSCTTDPNAGTGALDLTLIVVAVVLAVAAAGVAERYRRERRRDHQERIVALLLTTFMPAVARADPRELLAWRTSADSVRELFPEAVATIEAQTGERFPFPRAVVEDAHAQWTADWLAWERQHDTAYRERAATLEAELQATGGDDAAAAVRAKIATLEDERLQTYQRRYEDYVRVGNGLIALTETAG